ncbi:cyclin-domain-containing protein [Chytriomyces sp. MP71]|nr:cyclin-domain-containing protein [Chytriomyces sp. MP71]
MQRTSLPPVFDDCPVEAIMTMIIEMLDRLTSHNDNIPLSHANLTRFHSRAIPGISVADYVRRIVKYASIEKAVVLLVLVYIDRICDLHKTFTISSLTSHRFLISALTSGSKAVSDIYCTNTHFAKVGGITLQELNLLEVEFCTMINWRLACNHQLLQQYYVNLVRTSSSFVIQAAGSGDIAMS